MRFKYWYLSRRLIPELRLFDDDKLVEAALADAKTERRGLLILLSFGYVGVILLAAILGRWLGGRLGLVGFMQPIMQLVGVLIGLSVMYNFGFRKPLQRSLRETLRRHGVPICLGCGYDLRGHDQADRDSSIEESPRCPECGELVYPES